MGPGDTFTSFEFEVPEPPDGLEWMPYQPQGTYILVVSAGAHETREMDPEPGRPDGGGSVDRDPVQQSLLVREDHVHPDCALQSLPVSMVGQQIPERQNVNGMRQRPDGVVCEDPNSDQQSVLEKKERDEKG